jgi:hypothetical protein
MMSIIKAIFAFILSLFGIHINQQTSNAFENKKYSNLDYTEAGSLSGTSAKTPEDIEMENKYGMWVFLKKIIDFVEQRFSTFDKEEVRQVGRVLNNMGTKFLGEIKVGRSPRAMGYSRSTPQQGKEQSL